MNPNLQAVLDHLDAIALKLGVAAAHMWPLIVRQQLIDGICSAIFVPLLIATMIITLKFCAKAHNQDKYADYPWMIGVCAILLPIPICIFTYWAIALLTNPEYYALRDIINMLGAK